MILYNYDYLKFIFIIDFRIINYLIKFLLNIFIKIK